MRTVASPSSPVLPVRVWEEGGIRALARVATEWDDLVARASEPTPFLRASFLRAWWRAFGRGRPRLVLVGEDGLAGGALFAHRWSRLRGIPVRELALAANVHSNRADLVAAAGREAEVGRALARWVYAKRTSWTVLRLPAIPEESAVLRAFREELDRLGFPVGAKAAERPPFIPLHGGRRAFEASLASKWKSNLRNREKRIAALGPVVHETVATAVPDLPRRLDECFALEAKTWKGSAGSAIDSRSATRRFYRQLAQAAAEEGTLRLHTLRAGGRLAAFQLDMEMDGTEYVLKIGYEPALSKLSPGGLLMKRVVESAIDRGLTCVDLLGDEMPWKRDWTSQLRPHVTFFAFGRGVLGRTLHAMEFVAVPLLKSLGGRPSRPRSAPGKSDDATAPRDDVRPAAATAEETVPAASFTRPAREPRRRSVTRPGARAPGAASSAIPPASISTEPAQSTEPMSRVADTAPAEVSP